MNSAETDLKVFWIRADQRWMSLRRQPGKSCLKKNQYYKEKNFSIRVQRFATKVEKVLEVRYHDHTQKHDTFFVDFF